MFNIDIMSKLISFNHISSNPLRDRKSSSALSRSTSLTSASSSSPSMPPLARQRLRVNADERIDDVSVAVETSPLPAGPNRRFLGLGVWLKSKRRGLFW